MLDTKFIYFIRGARIIFDIFFLALGLKQIKEMNLRKRIRVRVPAFGVKWGV